MTKVYETVWNTYTAQIATEYANEMQIPVEGKSSR